MCHVCSGQLYDRPISENDIEIVKKHYPEVDSATVEDFYSAITDYHTPQPAVLVTLVELFKRAQEADNGIYEWPVVPFSALDLDTWNRVQTPEMQAFHSVFESMALAQRNVALVNDVFKKHGFQFFMFCDCGCGVAKADVDIFNSKAYKEINAVRSEMEAIGTDVIVAPSFDDMAWTDKRLDMGTSEVASYVRMWKVLCQVSGIKETFRSGTVQGMKLLESLARV